MKIVLRGRVKFPIDGNKANNLKPVTCVGNLIF